MFGAFACTRRSLWAIKCKFCENSPSHNPPLSAWGVWEGVIHLSPSRSGGLRGFSWFRDLGFSDVELEEMESEQTGLAFSLPPSPKRVRVNSPVKFTQDYLFPSPRARDTVSFRIDDVLLTAASDFEDFGPTLADAIPLSGQEARPSPAYSELVDMLFACHWEDRAGLARRAPLFETRRAVS